MNKVNSQINCPDCRRKTIALKQCPCCQNSYCDLCVEELVRLYSHPETPGCLIKVCQRCSTTVSNIRQLIEIEGLQEGVLSRRGQVWLRNCGAVDFMMDIGDDIKFYLQKDISEEDFSLIQKDVYEGRSDPEVYNWEMHELLSRIAAPNHRELVARVLQSYCARNWNIGYCQGLNNVAVWLLVFMDENSAFWMLCRLIEAWLLPDFYSGSKNGNSLNGFYIESTVIAALMEHLMPQMTNSSINSMDYCDFFSINILIQLFVNCIDLESTIFLWDRISAEGSIALIRGTISLLLIKEREVIAGNHPFDVLKSLLNSHLASQLKLVYPEIESEITETRVQRLRKQSRDFRAYQWRSDEGLVLKRLEQATCFTANELKVLQEQFNLILTEKRQQMGKHKKHIKRGSVILPNHISQQIKDKEAEIDIGLTIKEYSQILKNYNPYLENLSEQLFHYFDEDRSGYIDFRELVVSISVLYKGGFEDKLRVAFDIHDINKKGYLTQPELNDLANTLMKPFYHNLYLEFSIEYMANITKMHQTYLQIIQNCTSGRMTFKDLVKIIKSTPILYEGFNKVFELSKMQEDAKYVLMIEGLEKTKRRVFKCSLVQQSMLQQLQPKLYEIILTQNYHTKTYKKPNNDIKYYAYIFNNS